MPANDSSPLGIKEAITDLTKRAIRYLMQLLRLATSEGSMDLAKISRCVLALASALMLAVLAMIFLLVALISGIAWLMGGNVLAASLTVLGFLLVLAFFAYQFGARGLAKYDFLKQTRSQIHRDLP